MAETTLVSAQCYHEQHLACTSEKCDCKCHEKAQEQPQPEYGAQSELTIHTGCAGATHGINIDWFDHNNVKYLDRILIVIEEQDKPRTLSIIINKKVVFQHTEKGELYA